MMIHNYYLDVTEKKGGGCSISLPSALAETLMDCSFFVSLDVGRALTAFPATTSDKLMPIIKHRKATALERRFTRCCRIIQGEPCELFLPPVIKAFMGLGRSDKEHVEHVIVEVMSDHIRIVKADH